MIIGAYILYCFRVLFVFCEYKNVTGRPFSYSVVLLLSFCDMTCDTTFPVYLLFFNDNTIPLVVLITLLLQY